MRALVNILKASPPAHVEDKQMSEVSAPRLHVFDQFGKATSVFDLEAAFALVTIGTDDG
jgi:hypothetical protein